MERQIQTTFGELLARFRQRAQLRQQELAEKIGVHRNTIGAWERGDRLPETRGMVMEVARHLHLSVQETCHLLESSLIALSPYWTVPYRRNPFFTGREQILRQLHEALGQQQTTNITQSYALCGLGGIGKTHIAVEYAYRYYPEYSAVFWLHADDEERLFASIVALSDALKLPLDHNRERDRAVVAVLRWLTTHRGWLLIIDNVDDLVLVQRVLPAARQGALLMTTRHQAIGTLACAIEVPVMEPKEGSQLFLRRAKLLAPQTPMEQSAYDDDPTVQMIVEALGGLPLAIDQAGAYLEETHCTLLDFWQYYQTHQSYLLCRRGEQSLDYPLSVSTMLRISLEKIERCNPAVLDLLQCCAFLHPDAIPLALFVQAGETLGPTLAAAAQEDGALDALIAYLLQYSLIRRNSDAQHISMHRLVQVVIKEDMAPSLRQMWVERVTAAVTALFPPHDKAQADYWQACERLLPHALVCIAAGDQCSTDPATRASLMNHVAHYQANLARYAEADRLHRCVLLLCEQLPGREHPEMAEALNGLARSAKVQGNYAEAESLVLRALQMRERIFGAEHPKVAGVLNNLAILYLEQQRYTQAEPLLQRALQIYERSFGPIHPQIAASLHNLANIYLYQEKYGQAEIFFRRALQIWEQTLGTEHSKVALPLCGLAEIHQKQGRYAEAERLFQRTLDIVEHTLGAEHPDVADALTFLGNLYVEERRYAEAETTYRRALHIREHALEAAHPLIVAVLDVLADLYRRQGRHEEAELVRQHALPLV